MNDQMFRDLVAIIIIGTVLILASLGHTIPPQVQEWADVAFGFLFGFKTAGYTIGKDNPPAPPVASVTTTISTTPTTEVKSDVKP